MNTHTRFGLVERVLARDFGLMETCSSVIVLILVLYFNSFRSAFLVLVCGAHIHTGEALGLERAFGRYIYTIIL
jgi:hypothetical protein